MSSKSEISELIHRAMQEKHVDEAEMAKLLGVSPIMMSKIMTGEVVPSRHLKKQMVEVLGINSDKADHVAEDRLKEARAEQEEQEKTRQAA